MPNFHFAYFSRYVLRFFYTSIICLPFLLSSCENCTFISDNVQFAAVSFYANGSEVALDTSFSKIVGVFTRTNEAMPDSLDYNPTIRQKIFELPIFTRVDTTMFVFYKYRNLSNTVRDTVQDTLIMKYRVNVEVLPPDCGYDEAINNLEIIYHTFANVEILQFELKELKDNQPHIKIFR